MDSYTDYNSATSTVVSFYAKQTKRKCSELWTIINLWHFIALGAGRRIVDELVSTRSNQPDSQLHKIPEPIHICNSQQIIFGRIGGNPHDLVYSGNSISNSNHKDSHIARARFQCISIWYGQVCSDVWSPICDKEDPFIWGRTATFDKKN